MLEGRQAVCFPGFEGELKGAKLSEKPVCVDGSIITAKGMGVATQFGLTHAGLSAGQGSADKIHTSIQSVD